MTHIVYGAINKLLIWLSMWWYEFQMAVQSYKKYFILQEAFWIISQTFLTLMLY